MKVMKLTWNTHYSSIFTELSSFLNDEVLVDITLAAEGQFLKAHRILLCACSQFFRDLISSLDKDKQPVIFLQGVKFAQLQTLMKFIYCGEIQVASEELPALLSIAEELKIKGILDYHSDLDQPTPATATGVSNHNQSTSIAGSSQKLPISVVPKAASTSASLDKRSNVNTNSDATRSSMPLKRPRIGPKSKVSRQEPQPQSGPDVSGPLQHSRLDNSNDYHDHDGHEFNEEMEQYLADAEVKIEVGEIEQGDDIQIMSPDFGGDDEHERWNEGAGADTGVHDDEKATTSKRSLSLFNSETAKAGSSQQQQEQQGIGLRATRFRMPVRRGPRERQRQMDDRDPLLITASSIANATAAVRSRRRLKAKLKGANKSGRLFYTLAQKKDAVELLRMGYSCRQVAELMGPGCSSGTPIRWRQQLEGKYNRKRGPKPKGTTKTLQTASDTAFSLPNRNLYPMDTDATEGNPDTGNDSLIT